MPIAVAGADFSTNSDLLWLAVLGAYDYVFSENGLVAHQNGKQIAIQSLRKHLGEDNLKRLINFVLHYIADLDIPIKRGTFIEFRNGMINVSPIGRNCSQEERDEFERYDKEANVRWDWQIMLDIITVFVLHSCANCKHSPMYITVLTMEWPPDNGNVRAS